MRNMKILKATILLLLAFLSVVEPAAAQQAGKLVKGRVLDESGAPIPGAVVFSTRSKTSTTTDIDGQFEMKALPEDVLGFSFLGFKDYSAHVRDVDGKTVTLQTDSERLDDAVVIGYGVRKRENLTGAVSSIGGGKELKTATSSSLAQDLAGKVAGLQIRHHDSKDVWHKISHEIRIYGECMQGIKR